MQKMKIRQTQTDSDRHQTGIGDLCLIESAHGDKNPPRDAHIYHPQPPKMKPTSPYKPSEEKDRENERDSKNISWSLVLSWEGRGR